ncbi:hypothetical protein DFH08DRAFT_810109 [Mycena albidolilacea]|uniref:Uncharacterized protein n=1 Tax=Mycena albidolilacea TaxID=1033008 RepID=A0AAD6ZYY4_9AGAR|nr:hypothetical protein DFH08DRAFT_810109 [Mycena albidolilacea]
MELDAATEVAICTELDAATVAAIRQAEEEDSDAQSEALAAFMVTCPDLDGEALLVAFESHLDAEATAMRSMKKNQPRAGPSTLPPPCCPKRSRTVELLVTETRVCEAFTSFPPIILLHNLVDYIEDHPITPDDIRRATMTLNAPDQAARVNTPQQAVHEEIEAEREYSAEGWRLRQRSVDDVHAFRRRAAREQRWMGALKWAANRRQQQAEHDWCMVEWEETIRRHERTQRCTKKVKKERQAAREEAATAAEATELSGHSVGAAPVLSVEEEDEAMEDVGPMAGAPVLSVEEEDVGVNAGTGATAGAVDGETDNTEKEENEVQGEEVNDMGAAPAPPDVEEDSLMKTVEMTENAADNDMEGGEVQEGEVQGEVMEDNRAQDGAPSGYARGDESDLTPLESDDAGMAGVGESVSHAQVLRPRKRVSDTTAEFQQWPSWLEAFFSLKINQHLPNFPALWTGDDHDRWAKFCGTLYIQHDHITGAPIVWLVSNKIKMLLGRMERAARVREWEACEGVADDSVCQHFEAVYNQAIVEIVDAAFEAVEMDLLLSQLFTAVEKNAACASILDSLEQGVQVNVSQRQVNRLALELEEEMRRSDEICDAMNAYRDSFGVEEMTVEEIHWLFVDIPIGRAVYTQFAASENGRQYGSVIPAHEVHNGDLEEEGEQGLSTDKGGPSLLALAGVLYIRSLPSPSPISSFITQSANIRYWQIPTRRPDSFVEYITQAPSACPRHHYLRFWALNSEATRKKFSGPEGWKMDAKRKHGAFLLFCLHKFVALPEMPAGDPMIITSHAVLPMSGMHSEDQADAGMAPARPGQCKKIPRRIAELEEITTNLKLHTNYRFLNYSQITNLLNNEDYKLRKLRLKVSDFAIFTEVQDSFYVASAQT